MPASHSNVPPLGEVNLASRLVMRVFGYERTDEFGPKYAVKSAWDDWVFWVRAPETVRVAKSRSASTLRLLIRVAKFVYSAMVVSRFRSPNVGKALLASGFFALA